MTRRWLTYMALVALVALTVVAAASARPGSSVRSADYQTKLFIEGAAIHGANGLAVDVSGRLLVASAFGGELVVLDPQTGQVLDRLGRDVVVDSPDDVAVGPDGSIYWTEMSLGEVGRLAPNGQVTKQFVAPGMNPIAFTEGGRLFVGQAFFGDGLFELDPELVDPPRVVIADSGVPPYFGQLNGFDFGPDGMLYSPQPFLGRIVKVDPESGALEVVTDAFAADPPTSAEFNSRGELFVSLAEGTIVRVDPDTSAFEAFTRIRDAVRDNTTTDPVPLLDNMTFDARGRLFVSNSNTGAIYAVAPGGGVRTLVPGGLILPGGIAVIRDASGRDSIFVADFWSLAQFDEDSGALLEIDRQSRAGGGIVQPWTVAPDGGNLIITSWMANAVQIWDPLANAQVEVFTDFAVPLNAIRFQGQLVVAELGTGSVARKDETGTRSVLASGLFVPSGLAATDDDLWVADWATGIVWKLVADGAVLPTPQFTAGGLSFPEGMAVDRDGSLLVVESGAGRLSRIDPLTGQVTTVADGLEVGVQESAAAPPTWAMSSVAVGRKGTIFVTGDRANVVYRLRSLPAS